MKKIVFLHTKIEYERFKKYREEIHDDTHIDIIAYDLKLRIFLKFNNIKYKIQEDYFDIEKAPKIDNLAFYIADNWHKDRFIYNGVSLGQLHHSGLKYLISTILRDIETINKILKIEEPSEIVIFESIEPYIYELNKIIKKICLLNNIPLTIYSINQKSTRLITKSKKILRIQYLKGVLSQIFFLYIINFVLKLRWFFRTSKLFRRNQKKHNILLLYYTSMNKRLFNQLSEKFNINLLYPRPDSILIKKNFLYTFFNRGKGYYRFISEYSNKKLVRKYNTFLKNAIIEWKSIVKTLRFQEIFKYKGMSIWPFLKETIYKIIFYEFRKNIENIILLKRLLKKTKINFILFSADVSEFPMIVAIISQKLNIPSLVIQHGVLGLISGFMPCFSEKFAAWGKISNDLLITHGMPPKKLAVTGFTRADQYFLINNNKRIKEKIKLDVYNDFGIKKNQKLIVLATTHIEFHFMLCCYEKQIDIEKLYYCILESVQKIPNTFLVIKLHPYDKYAFVAQKIVNHLGFKNVKIIQEYPIEKILIASDCVIVTYSGTGLEAMILEKPVIRILIGSGTPSSSLFNYPSDSVYEVFKCEELYPSIKDALIHPKKKIVFQKKFLKDYLFRLDAKSTDRVLKLINQMIPR